MYIKLIDINNTCDDMRETSIIIPLADIVEFNHCIMRQQDNADLERTIYTMDIYYAKLGYYTDGYVTVRARPVNQIQYEWVIDFYNRFNETSFVSNSGIRVYCDGIRVMGE